MGPCRKPARAGAGARERASHLTSATDLLRDAKATLHSSGLGVPTGNVGTGTGQSLGPLPAMKLTPERPSSL